MPETLNDIALRIWQDRLTETQLFYYLLVTSSWVSWFSRRISRKLAVRYLHWQSKRLFRRYTAQMDEMQQFTLGRIMKQPCRDLPKTPSSSSPAPS